MLKKFFGRIGNIGNKGQEQAEAEALEARIAEYEQKHGAAVDTITTAAREVLEKVRAEKGSFEDFCAEMRSKHGIGAGIIEERGPLESGVIEAMYIDGDDNFIYSEELKDQELNLWRIREELNANVPEQAEAENFSLPNLPPGFLAEAEAEVVRTEAQHVEAVQAANAAEAEAEDKYTKEPESSIDDEPEQDFTPTTGPAPGM